MTLCFIHSPRGADELWKTLGRDLLYQESGNLTSSLVLIVMSRRRGLPSSDKGYMVRAAHVLASFRPGGGITAITLGLNLFGNGRRVIHVKK